MILVLGIDAATWRVIDENLHRLRAFRKLIDEAVRGTIYAGEKPLSAAVWCSMFSGMPPEEHKHYDYVKDNKLVKIEDLDIEFLWDFLHKKGYSVVAINVPVVIPPFSFGCEFRPVAYGLPITENEMLSELDSVTEAAKSAIKKQRPDVLISVYTVLDRVQHLYWGEPVVADWYARIDRKLGEIYELLSPEDKLIVVSDHGFCSREDVKEHTLPPKTEWGEIKGDHHPEGIVIAKNITQPIRRPEDVYYAVINSL